MSHDLLEDLLADVPRHVTADPASAWRAGTQRRRRTYAVEALAVAAAVALVGLGLVLLHDRTPVQPVGPSKTVEGYPRDVPRPFFEPMLPSAPGPAAGVIEADGDWHLVSADGRVWRLPLSLSYPPTLSADGVWLAMMRPDGPDVGHLEVRNLVNGGVTSYPDVGEGRSTGDGHQVTDQRYSMDQAAGFWSPDGARLLVPGESVDNPHGAALMLERGEVSVLGGHDTPIGWTSPSTLAWLGTEVRGTTVYVNRHDLVVTDVERRELSRVELRDRPRLTFINDVVVSPDGSKLAVLAERDSSTSIRVFSLSTGEELPEAGVSDADAAGLPVWRGDDVLCWTGEGLIDPAHATTLVRLSQRWGATTAAWAPDALIGSPHDGPSPVGWRFWPVWWWWKPILIGLVLALGALGLWLLDRWDTRKHLRAT